jgi:hypothetical protein
MSAANRPVIERPGLMMRLQVWPLFGLQDPQLWYFLEKDLL